jgi:hypothetical protein
MGVLQIRKKMLVCLMVGFLISILIGSMSVSATIIDNLVFNKTSPLGFEDNGDVAAFIFYEQLGKNDQEPRIVVIEDATVSCKDINGEAHEMTYQELEPGLFGYFATDIPAGNCQISASKDGYSTETIDAIVFTYGYDIYRIELDEIPDSHFAHHGFFGSLLKIFPILKFLLIL